MNLRNQRAAPKASQRATQRAGWLAGINALCLVSLWLFESRVGEAFWLSGALCYVPQHPVLLPTLVLLAVALKRRSWKIAGAYALTLGWAAHVFLGLQIPIASTWRRATSAPSRLKLRVMTYNIRGAVSGIERVAATIRAQQPDVLFLQEAVVINDEGNDDPVAPLHAALPGYHEARAGEVCIFSRFPVLAQHEQQFPDGASRFVLEAILDVNGTPIRAITVHPYTIALRGSESLRAGRRALPRRIEESMRLRNGQVSTLLSTIERPPSTWKPEWRQAPLLVAGDFNTPPRGRIYNAMAARLGDSWREAGWGLGDSYSSTLPVVRIDYVWHSPQWSAIRAIVPASDASDHRPLVVDLGL